MTLEAILNKCRQVSVEALEKGYAADPDKLWPEESMRELLRQGLGGLMVSSAHGGLEQGLYTLVRCCEILGTSGGSLGLCFGMHNVGTAVIAAKATEYQAKNFLEPIAAGNHTTTLALSEPGSGSHFYIPQTQLLAAEKGFIVNGVKFFVTNGGRADSYVLSTMAADPDAPPDQFSCIVLPEGTEGMSWGEEWRGLGMRQNSARALNMNDVYIPSGYLLGEQGDQLWYIFNVVAPTFLIAMSGTYLGIATAALDEAVAHIKKRTYAFSGASLSQYAVIQHKVGKLFSLLEATRRLIYHAAEAADQKDPGAMPALLSCKAVVGENVIKILDECMNLIGGSGYQENGRMANLLHDAHAAPVMAPTTDLLYTWTGRALLEQPILAD